MNPAVTTHFAVHPTAPPATAGQAAAAPPAITVTPAPAATAATAGGAPPAGPVNE